MTKKPTDKSVLAAATEAHKSKEPLVHLQKSRPRKPKKNGETPADTTNAVIKLEKIV